MRDRMNHDALGKKNVNGAIFPDSRISPKTWPCTYFLYGHSLCVMDTILFPINLLTYTISQSKCPCPKGCHDQ